MADGRIARSTDATRCRPRLALLAGLVVAAGCAPAAEQRFDVVWVGDILLGDAAQDALEIDGYDWPFAHIASGIEGDYLIGNGEGPITELTEAYFPDQEFEYNADPESAQALARAGFDAIGLSNNHILDRGPEGLDDTVRNLEDAGIQPFGAGLLPAAEAPLLISTPHGAVAVLAFGEEWNAGALATPTTVGTVPMTAEAIARGREGATAADARWIVAYVHWGENYAEVDPRQREVAALFADAGYDLVIGHHPHVVQSIEVIDGMPVIYSVGNFTFGTPGRFDADARGYGLIVRTAFGTDTDPHISLSCIVTDNDVVEFQPQPCSVAEARAVYAELGPAASILGDGTAVVEPGE